RCQSTARRRHTRSAGGGARGSAAEDSVRPRRSRAHTGRTQGAGARTSDRSGTPARQRGPHLDQWPSDRHWRDRRDRRPFGRAHPGVGRRLMNVQLPDPLTLIVILGALALVPFVAIMVTSFVKLAVVLTLIRNALGVQQIPPNSAIYGLAIILTVYIMAPVG